MEQLLAHLIGDYILQSHWMAENKTKAFWPAFVHALLYSLPFVLIAPSGQAWGVIFFTHFLIDRYRLARYLVWAKNLLGPWRRRYEYDWGDGRGLVTYAYRYDGADRAASRPIHAQMSVAPPVAVARWTAPIRPLAACPTGYDAQVPGWLAVGLLIVADNTLHLVINYLAIYYL